MGGEAGAWLGCDSEIVAHPVVQVAAPKGEVALQRLSGSEEDGMAGFGSTWLVGQQEHAAGKSANFNLIHGDFHRGTEWTDHDGAAGDLASSPWQVLPPGEYTALLQVWSEHRGKAVGHLIAETDGGTVIGI